MALAAAPERTAARPARSRLAGAAARPGSTSLEPRGALGGELSAIPVPSDDEEEETTSDQLTTAEGSAGPVQPAGSGPRRKNTRMPRRAGAGAGSEDAERRGRRRAAVQRGSGTHAALGGNLNRGRIRAHPLCPADPPLAFVFSILWYDHLQKEDCVGRALRTQEQKTSDQRDRAGKKRCYMNAHKQGPTPGFDSAKTDSVELFKHNKLDHA